MIQGTFLALIVAVVAALIVKWLGWLFTKGQLYVVVPNLFKMSNLDGNGQVIELELYNKSRRVEEDVRLQLDKNYEYTLLASTDNEVSFAEGQIFLERFPPNSVVTIILVIQDGKFTQESISRCSSRTTTGKVLESRELVKPNSGNTAILAILPVLFVGLLILLPWGYEQLKSTYAQYKMSFVFSQGWTDLDKYINSDLRTSYSDNEFPITVTGFNTTNKFHSFSFALINKTATDIKIFVSINSWDSERVIGGVGYLKDSLLDTDGFPGLYTGELVAKANKTTEFIVRNEYINDEIWRNYYLEFSLTFGGEFIHGIRFNPRKYCENVNKVVINGDKCTGLFGSLSVNNQ